MNKKKNVSKSNSSNKYVSWIRFLLSLVVIIGIGYVIFNYVPFIAKYDHYVIVTGSMEPVIMTGDIVIVDSDVDPEELTPGQIIAFKVDLDLNGTDEIVVHYLYSITDVDGVTIYKTKPEVSNQVDPWSLTIDDIVGTHVFTIQKIGPLILFVQSTIGKVVLVIDIIIVYALMEMFSSKKKKQEPEAEITTDEKTD